MSFIVKGLHKPRQCEEWRNGKMKRCWFLDENDDCTLQKTVKTDWQTQYAGCPIVALKWIHGKIVDTSRNEVVLEEENDVYGNLWKNK